MTYEELADNNANTWDNASHFSYDIHGNANVVVQENKALGTGAAGRKTLTYQYDLISGAVLAVHYQQGQFDEFHHRYEYDAENRLVTAFSSRNGLVWEKESRNIYAATGQVLRTELGDKLVQGTDYAFTLQGWLKVMNAGSLNAQRDMGKDGYAESITGTQSVNRDAGQDAAGQVLGYYDRDYWSPALGATVVADRFLPRVSSATTQADYRALYNGNIAYQVVSLMSEQQLVLDNQLTAYRYDQLQRIKTANAHRNYNSAANDFNGTTANAGAYKEGFTYDRNGNILTVSRYGNLTGGAQLMDQLTYRYIDRSGAVMTYAGGWGNNATNRLGFVQDAAVATNYTTDIDNQSSGNYQYDGIGNLVSDATEQIAKISWRADGKIAKIERTPGSTKSDLEFLYDASGQRIAKLVKPRTAAGVKSQLHWTITYYVRDASGNVMGVYERSFVAVSGSTYSDKLNLAELHIYGGKRLGVLNADSLTSRTFTDANFTDVVGQVFVPSYNATTINLPCTTRCVVETERRLGRKVFELCNHLGNVLATVSDRKLAVDKYAYSSATGGSYKYDAALNVFYAVAAGTGTHNRILASSDLRADGYVADVRSYSDYYAFGSALPGRTGNSGDYRYGFNGKETDPESDLQDYGFRIYNTRLGKFLSVDPLTTDYPELTPYQFASNTPIQAIDLDGLEAFFVHGTNHGPSAWLTVPQIANTIFPYTGNKTKDMNFSWKVPQNKNDPSGAKLNRLMNDKFDRAVAARMLVDYVVKYRKDHNITDEHITLIGYSHGGNVAIQAAKLFWNEYQVQVNIITINTPPWNSSGHSENPFMNPGINSIIHFSTAGDPVAGGLSGDTNDNIGTFKYKGAINFYLFSTKFIKPEWYEASYISPMISNHYLENTNYKMMDVFFKYHPQARLSPIEDQFKNPGNTWSTIYPNATIGVSGAPVKLRFIPLNERNNGKK